MASRKCSEGLALILPAVRRLTCVRPTRISRTAGRGNINFADYIRASRWYLWSLTGTPRNFNAIAFYLHLSGKHFQWSPNDCTWPLLTLHRHACQGGSLRLPQAKRLLDLVCVVIYNHYSSFVIRHDDQQTRVTHPRPRAMLQETSYCLFVSSTNRDVRTTEQSKERN